MYVEDISRADAPAEVIATRAYAPARFSPDGVFSFDVQVPTRMVHARARYGVRVHVAVNGANEVERGDYVSTQSHPVLTWGAGTTAKVPVRLV